MNGIEVGKERKAEQEPAIFISEKDRRRLLKLNEDVRPGIAA
jgi:hypothetical protein